MQFRSRLQAMAASMALSWALLVQAGDARAQSIVRKALVIGNDNYSVGRLKNAGNDAKGIAEALTDLKYQVALSLNANRAPLANSVDVFAQNLNPGDFAVVYYSGHGLQAEGLNYLIPTDFVLGDDDQYTLQQHAYSLAEVLTKILGREPATLVVILDACRDNPFVSSRSAKRGWGPIKNELNGTYIAFATAPGAVASDNPSDVHGLFTKALLQYIGQPLDLDSLFASVRREVIEASHGKQVPWTSSSLIRSVSFNPKVDSTNALASSVSASVSDGLIPANDSNPTSIAAATMTRSLRSESGAADLDDTSARLLISNALILARHNRIAEAVKILDAAISAVPWSSLPLRILGLLFHLLGRRSEAVDELDRALAIDPSDFKALYYRCLALAPEDPAAAIGNCESSLGIKPSFASAHLGLSNAWLAVGDVDKAYREASRSVDLLPRSSLAFSLRGRCKLAMGKYEDAQRDFERARILQERSELQNAIVP